MIIQPFKIDDHRHLKVCYTLDHPAKSERRQQLMEYILDVAAAGRTEFTPDEWDVIVNDIIHSSQTVGAWLEEKEKEQCLS
tara:strand:- start:154 stop:396 length:243 start_codon:yes stop_codon:yes gene_type:complete